MTLMENLDAQSQLSSEDLSKLRSLHNQYIALLRQLFMQILSQLYDDLVLPG